MAQGNNTLKPVVYIASPYSNGDPEKNTFFQCLIFNKLLDDGRVLPVAPLWSHYQHITFPRNYEDWIKYDQEMLPLYDCCLRLNAQLDEFDYFESKSNGADEEVKTFLKLGKPVFYSIDELLEWVENG